LKNLPHLGELWSMSIHVQLERFEGPLGLLLHLIREQEMDIFNINIHQITRQYLEYIKTMRRLDLEVAGEFVSMAATLIHIKSRMLLPNYNEEGEEITEDPRKELVQKLMEYKKFQELSQKLYKLPLLGRDVFRRGERTEIESLEEGELVLEENPLYSLIAAYRVAVKNMKQTVHNVAAQLVSIGERIMQMKDFFVVGRRMLFSELITDRENPKNQVLLTFLSLLELAKMGFVSIFQAEPMADIHIDPKRAIDRDVISQVESYDSVNAAAKADEIINSADAQLSLEESVIEPEDVAGDAPVVQESFADAASDEDIEAEERRIASEDEILKPDPEVGL
jgi:segregation and condensation protein A